MNFILPKLNSSDSFEELTRDLFAIRFKNPNLQRYGRSGQKQNGIDIVGIAGRDYTNDCNVVIQCKNHTIEIKDTKLCDEIDTELAAFDKSTFKDNHFFFVTSANNSVDVINHVEQINNKREENSQHQIVIMFWDDVSREILKNQFLLHRYYGKQFAFAAPEVIDIPDANINSRKTLRITLSNLENSKNIPAITSVLKKVCISNLNGKYRLVEPYNLYLGLSSHTDHNFNSRVDFDIDASSYFSDLENLEENYQKLVKSLTNLAKILSDTFFAKNLVLLSNTETNLAFLVGKILRRQRLEVNTQFKAMFFTTNNSAIAYLPSMVSETFLQTSQLSSEGSDDLVLVVNMALRMDITNDVLKFIKNWQSPYIFRSYGTYNGNKIENSAHASSIADDISSKIQSFQNLGLKRIHLFLAMPKPLALLIGYKLNTLNTEIHLYFRSSDRSIYLKTGVLKNNTFEGLSL